MKMRAKQKPKASRSSRGLVLVKAGYESVASSNNRAPISHVVQDADKDLTASVLKELRKRSRYLDCNSAVYSGAIKRMCTLIVGSGIMATATSAKDAEWANVATREFSKWGKRCDVAQVSSLPAIQSIIVHSLLVDGECFVLKTRDEETQEPRIQVLEAHQITDVICTDVGRPMFYAPIGAKSGTIKDPSPDWYSADDVIHFFRQSRPGQKRGIPLFTAAINTAQDVDEIVNMEKAASKAAGKTVEVVNRKGGRIPKIPVVAARMQAIEEAGKPDAYYQEIVGPAGLVLDIDEKYEQVASQRPSTAWQGFIDFLLNIFCLAGDMPPSAFLQLKVGGADTRRDLASAQRVIEQWQQLVADGLLRVWLYFVENYPAVSKGRPEDAGEVVFQYPRKITVDDGRASISDRADITSGTMTVDEYCGQYGASGSEHIRQLKAEMREVNPLLDDTQINALLLKRMFGVDMPLKSVEIDTASGEQVSAVQDTALNGAQVTALVEIALKVSTGELPPASAIAIARASFPGVPAETIAAIFALDPKPAAALPAKS